MLAKYINKNHIKMQSSRTILYQNGKQIINPKDEDFIADGYKKLIEYSMPTFDTDIEYLDIEYEDTESAIIKHWHIQSIPIEERGNV